MSFSEYMDEQVRLERLRETAEGTGVEARRARYALRRRYTGKIDACPSGHEYTEDNTHYETGRGRRRCLTCLAAQRVHLSPTYRNRNAIDLTAFTEARKASTGEGDANA